MNMRIRMICMFAMYQFMQAMSYRFAAFSMHALTMHARVKMFGSELPGVIPADFVSPVVHYAIICKQCRLDLFAVRSIHMHASNSPILKAVMMLDLHLPVDIDLHYQLQQTSNHIPPLSSHMDDPGLLHVVGCCDRSMKLYCWRYRKYAMLELAS